MVCTCRSCTTDTDMKWVWYLYLLRFYESDSPHELEHGVFIFDGGVLCTKYLGPGCASMGEPAPMFGHHILDIYTGNILTLGVLP
jgi:hypothetical protein